MLGEAKLSKNPARTVVFCIKQYQSSCSFVASTLHQYVSNSLDFQPLVLWLVLLPVALVHRFSKDIVVEIVRLHDGTKCTFCAL